MQTIKATTQRGQAFLNSYYNSNAYTLRECYGSHSYEKERAENDCREMMRKENGEGFRILSYNTFSFTCGWIIEEGLRVETRLGSYLIK